MKFEMKFDVAQKKCDECLFGYSVSVENEGCTHKTWQHRNDIADLCINAGKVILSFVLASFLLALPAEAGILKKAKHCLAGAVGVVTAPVCAPLGMMAKRSLVRKYCLHGNYKAAAIVDKTEVYDIYWLENWW